MKLMDAVLARDSLVHGVVTFKNMGQTAQSKKNGAGFPGLVSTPAQRLDFFMKRGFTFAIVIDFSDEFSKIEGRDFIASLVQNCGMAYLAEGDDFCCGYKGSCDIKEITALAREFSFALEVKESVVYKERKVSSSRIRCDVSAAHFSDVRVMLNRPYSLDCSGWQWTPNQNGVQTRGEVSQALPKDGVYAVTVRSDGKEIAAELRVTQQALAIQGAKRVTEIIFGE
jgi:FAD synthase